MWYISVSSDILWKKFVVFENTNQYLCIGYDDHLFRLG